MPSLWTGSGLLDNDWKWNMNWRLVFGVMTFAGAGLLAWDLLTIGACESREELVIEEH